MLPMPPDYMGYPTIHEITKAINQSGLIGVTMKEAEMKQLLDVLVYRSSRMFEEYNGDSGRKWTHGIAVRPMPGG